ncbi:hypothetical protein [Salipiger abyssi]|uniref:hypothetical protein n=1 Tax=Salipiger abyssi TaxID=1250539 RepID=UPI0040593BF9
MVRYVAIFMLPIVIAGLFHYAAIPLRLSAHEQATDLIGNALSPDAQSRSEAFDALAAGKGLGLGKWLDCLSVSVILLVGAVGGLMVSSAQAGAAILRLPSMLGLGFFAAHILFGFGYLGWLELIPWAAVALVLAGVVSWARRRNVETGDAS